VPNPGELHCRSRGEPGKPGKVGSAVCGAPVRQDQMTDDFRDVTCRRCWAEMSRAAHQQRRSVRA
jgi:hypothetical protein